MRTPEELQRVAEKIINRDLVHLNCDVTVEPFDGALHVKVSPRRFELYGVVVARPDKPDESLRLEIEGLRDTMIEQVFADASHWQKSGLKLKG